MGPDELFVELANFLKAKFPEIKVDTYELAYAVQEWDDSLPTCEKAEG